MVKDSQGQVVELFENRFTAEDKAGYTADITVTVGGKTYTKKLTIEVIDASIPKITINGTFFSGVAGKAYTLPTATVTKAYDETEIVPEIAVYLINAAGNVKMTIENNAFTPELPGDYLYEVVATDKYGYSSQKKEKFKIKDPNITTEVLVGFDDASSTTHVKPGSYTAVQPEWLEEFEGATGVVKAHTSDKYSNYGQSKLSVNTAMTEDDLKGILLAEDFGYVKVRAYFVGEENATYKIRSHNLTIAEVNANEWVDIIIKKDMILSTSPRSWWMNFGTPTGLERFALLHKQGGSGDYLFYVELTGDNITPAQEDRVGIDVYLDSITSEKATKEKCKEKAGRIRA